MSETDSEPEGQGCGQRSNGREVGRELAAACGDLAAADDAERTEIPHILDWLEQRIGPRREFLVGGAFTLADISVAVMFANVRGAGVALDAQKYPNVARWLAGVEGRPSFAAQNARMEKILARVQAEAGAG